MIPLDHRPTDGTSPGDTRQASGALEYVLLHESPASPVRALDWRWRVAESLAGTNPRPRRPWFDALTMRAVAFRERADRAGGPGDPRLVAFDPALAHAAAVRLGPDRRTRLAIEALLLSGRTDDVIAERSGLAADIIAVYHAVFFEVRPMLAHTDALLARAVGPGLYSSAPDLEASVKALALFGGPLVADAILEGLELLPPAGSVDDASRAELKLLAEQYTLLSSIPVDVRTTQALLTLYARSGELARAQADRSVASIMRPLAWPVRERSDLERLLRGSPDPGPPSDMLLNAASMPPGEDRRPAAPITPGAIDRDRPFESIREAG